MVGDDLNYEEGHSGEELGVVVEEVDPAHTSIIIN